jgi:hypothetical protein
MKTSRLFCVMVVATVLAGCSKSPEDVVCYSLARGDRQVDLAVPRALIPSKRDQNGGARFQIWFGVNLKDFSPAPISSNVDQNLSKPDWTIEKYGWNPGMSLSSGYSKAPYVNEIEAGKYSEVETDILGFRRFTECVGCGIDLYVAHDRSDVELIRCYVPGKPNGEITGCLVYERFGSGSLEYSFPYRAHQDLDMVRSRILDLLVTFENEGLSKCRG